MTETRLDETECLINPNLDKPLHIGKTLKIAVLASGVGSNFEAIVKSINSNELNIEVCVLIVNNNSCQAIKKAQDYNIPFEIIDHRLFNSREEFDKQIINRLMKYQPYALFMAGWMRIASKVLTAAFPDRILNIHPSLLPSFKGSKAIRKALDEKVLVTGCSVHLVSEEVDSGEILIQSAVPILNTDDEDKLRQCIQVQEHKIVPIGISLAAHKYWINRNHG